MSDHARARPHVCPSLDGSSGGGHGGRPLPRPGFASRGGWSAAGPAAAPGALIPRGPIERGGDGCPGMRVRCHRPSWPTVQALPSAEDHATHRPIVPRPRGAAALQPRPRWAPLPPPRPDHPGASCSGGAVRAVRPPDRPRATGDSSVGVHRPPPAQPGRRWRSARPRQRRASPPHLQRAARRRTSPRAIATSHDSRQPPELSLRLPTARLASARSLPASSPDRLAPTTWPPGALPTPPPACAHRADHVTVRDRSVDTQPRAIAAGQRHAHTR